MKKKRDWLEVAAGAAFLLTSEADLGLGIPVGAALIIDGMRWLKK